MRCTLALIILASIFVLSFGSPMGSRTLHNEVSSDKSWKDKQILDSFVDKDLRRIDQINGSVAIIELLKPNLRADTYNSLMNTKRDDLSEYLGYHIESNQEMEEILNFFSNKEGVSTSDKVKSMFTFANVLLVFGILIVFAALVPVVAICILPLVRDMSVSVKLITLYAIFAVVTAWAFVAPSNFSNYVGFASALSFGAAYVYHLATLKPVRDLSATLFLPPLFVWALLAITLKTRLIGFIAVIDFAAFLGFGLWLGPLCEAIGLHNEEHAVRALFSSGTLMIIYAVNAMGVFGHNDYLIEPFDSALFFVGTFVYFITLMIMSSRYYNAKATCCMNIVAVLSAVVVATLGSVLPSLAIFRGVGVTFALLFLMQKYVEIRWDKYWSLGLLGGGIIVIGICFLIKQYGSYLFFWNC